MFDYFNKKEKHYKWFAKLYNIDVKKSGKDVYVIKDTNTIKVKFDDYFNDAITLFSFYFNQVESEKKFIGFKKLNVIDYTKPKLHKLKNHDISFYFTSFAEGLDVAIDYLKKYNLKEGDIVFDCGAYCGISSYYFSKLVGETGKVYAFEPDKLNYKMLLKNIELHNLKNVIPINKGIWDKTDTLLFNTEGALGSALVNVFDRKIEATKNKVDVVSITDVVKEYNIPKIDFIKMDIEGAEIAAVEGIKDYLKNNDINFAIASYHVVDNERTYKKLESIFEEIGYDAETIRLYSDRDTGSLITYAKKNLNPAIKKPKPVLENIPQKDTLAYKTILEVLKKDNFQKKINNLAKNKKVIIYGTGMVCDIIFNNFDISGINIIAVSDKKYQNGSDNYRGLQAISPEKIAEQKPDVVLITLQNSFLAEDYFKHDLFPNYGKFKYKSIFV